MSTVPTTPFSNALIIGNTAIALTAAAISAIRNALADGRDSVTIDIKLDRAEVNANQIIANADAWLAAHPPSS